MELTGRALTGTIRSATPLEGARTPAYVLEVDFGPAGTKRAGAQITDLYGREELIGRQVVALVDLPPKRIAGVTSECLVLGVQTDEGVVLLATERPVPNGTEIF